MVSGEKSIDSLADREVALRDVADGKHDHPPGHLKYAFYTYTLAHACRHRRFSAMSHVPKVQGLLPDGYMALS
jgi:hypothetical protein